jgi:hypothetical protein
MQVPKEAERTQGNNAGFFPWNERKTLIVEAPGRCNFLSNTFLWDSHFIIPVK